MSRNWMLPAFFFILMVSFTTAQVDKVTVKETENVVVTKNQTPQIDGFSAIASFIGNMLRDYVIKPLSVIMNLLKKFSQHVYDNLEQVLAKVSHIMFKIFETKTRLMTDIPKKIFSALTTFFPNLEERLQPAIQRLEECHDKFPLDGIKQDVEQVKKCVKPSFNLTFHDKIVIADNSLEILKVVNQSLEELQNSNQQNRQEKLANVWKEIIQKGLPKVSEVIAAIIDIKKRVVEMLKCVTGEEGKGLLGDVMTYENNLMACLVSGSSGICQCPAQ